MYIDRKIYIYIIYIYIYVYVILELSLVSKKLLYARWQVNRAV